MSPARKKPRHCQCPYGRHAFKPTQIPMDQLEKIHLAKDELESVRLCDLLGLSQEDAGNRMKVSRGTVQRLVTRAREKIVRALIEKCALVMAEEGEEK
jgi:predicted DNA-binding protein (UPF0251 family)